MIQWITLYNPENLFAGCCSGDTNLNCDYYINNKLWPTYEWRTSTWSFTVSACMKCKRRSKLWKLSVWACVLSSPSLKVLNSLLRWRTKCEKSERDEWQTGDRNRQHRKTRCTVHLERVNLSTESEWRNRQSEERREAANERRHMWTEGETVSGKGVSLLIMAAR